MKSFRFSLQSLRVLREQKERAAQKRYAEALRDGGQAAARLAAGNRNLAEARSVLCKEVLAGNTISRLQQTRAWCRQLEQNCDQLAAALKSAEEAVGQAWREMLLATRDRKALDNLHQQRRGAYDYAMRREEQKQLDEMGLRLNETSFSLREPVATPGGLP
jgi:flagellar export protein FliJ